MGGLRRITLFELPTDPAPHADQCQIYAKDDSGRTELFFMDQAGSTTQITKDGYLDVQYEADVLGLPYELTDPASGVSKGSIYTKKVSGNVELFYIDSAGNVIQITENGSLIKDIVLVDTTYYVDGDSGSDTNDGLTWGTAKRTLAFLAVGQDDSLPRQLNANVVVYVRGDKIRAHSSSFHTIINGFFGPGSLTIQGVFSSVTTATATTYDNVIANRDGQIWVTDPTKSWTIDGYRRYFAYVGNKYYPIYENTATTLWAPFYRNFTPSESITIYKAPEIIRELDSNPNVEYDFPNWDSFFSVKNCQSDIYIKNLWIDERPGINYNIIDVVESAKVEFDCVSMGSFNSRRVSTLILNYNYFYLPNAQNYAQCSTGSYAQIYNCAFIGASTAYGPFIYGVDADLSSVVISGFTIGLSCIFGAVVSSISNNTIKNCTDAVTISDSDFEIYYYSTPSLRIDTVTRGISGTGNLVSYAGSISSWDTTKEIVFSTNNSESFSSFNAGTLRGQGPLGVGYFDTNSVPQNPNEYDNTTSGLDGYNYQDAIDELSVEKVQKSSGTASPNGVVSGNIGDIYIDTNYDISYINIDGTNTGWRVM